MRKNKWRTFYEDKRKKKASCFNEAHCLLEDMLHFRVGKHIQGGNLGSTFCCMRMPIDDLKQEVKKKKKTLCKTKCWKKKERKKSSESVKWIQKKLLEDLNLNQTE